MVDTVSPERRSEIMRRVRSKDTQPEMKVRKLVHGLGYRYRLHRKDIPGKPDLVFVGKKKVIFVHGCFWHGHRGCPYSKIPKSNILYWRNKIIGNMQRDRRNIKDLKALGWQALVLWECEIKKNIIKQKVTSFLED